MRLVFVLSLTLALTSFAIAATIFVPDDHSLIQDAINASYDGDTVIVRAGTYYENIDFREKKITVLGEQGPAATIVDGRDGLGCAVYGGDAVGSIVNATIAYNSSGIYSFNGTVINSVIYSNATGQIEGGSPVVTYCDVEGSYVGTGNIDEDPRFIPRIPFGEYFLEQDPCQQGAVNQCVDGGDPASDLITGTTRTDLVLDDQSVDLGYHYPGVIQVPADFATIQELHHHGQ